MIEMISGMAGGMVKMSIQKWTDKPDILSSLKAFHLMLNPEQYSEQWNIEYGPAKNDCHKEHPKATVSPPDVFTFDFILDGTGATGIKIDVDSKIREFRKLVTEPAEGETQNYLRLKWGTLQLICVFKSASIQYTMFTRTGRPLRAKVNATFGKVHAGEPSLLARMEQYTSEKIALGQNIVQLASKAYGSKLKLAKLAQINGLNSFRKIQAGSSIIFPPASKL